MNLIQKIDIEGVDQLSFKFGLVASGKTFLMLSNLQDPYMRNGGATDQRISTWCSNSVSRITIPSKLGDYFNPSSFEKRISATLNPEPSVNFNDRTLFMVVDYKAIHDLYQRNYGELIGMLISMYYNHNSNKLDLFFVLTPKSALGICDMIITQKNGRVYHKPPNSSKVVLVFRVDINNFLKSSIPNQFNAYGVPNHLKIYEEVIPRISILKE